MSGSPCHQSCDDGFMFRWRFWFRDTICLHIHQALEDVRRSKPSLMRVISFSKVLWDERGIARSDRAKAGSLLVGKKPAWLSYWIEWKRCLLPSMSCHVGHVRGEFFIGNVLRVCGDVDVRSQQIDKLFNQSRDRCWKYPINGGVTATIHWRLTSPDLHVFPTQHLPAPDAAKPLHDHRRWGCQAPRVDPLATRWRVLAACLDDCVCGH